MRKSLKEKEMEERGFIMIEWPESQRIMEHPLAIFEWDCDTYGSSAYWCPTEVWNEYKDSYYEEE